MLVYTSLMFMGVDDRLRKTWPKNEELLLDLSLHLMQHFAEKYKALENLRMWVSWDRKLLKSRKTPFTSARSQGWVDELVMGNPKDKSFLCGRYTVAVNITGNKFMIPICPGIVNWNRITWFML